MTNPLVISYLTLRKIVGAIGISLPWVLILGNIVIEGPGLLTSLSSYYHNSVGGIFIGALWAIGVFLLSYRGYERRDDIAGDLACVFAIGTAILPTSPEIGATKLVGIIGIVHLIMAGGLFATLAYFSLALFRKTGSSAPPTRMKMVRNRIYGICGALMIGCLVAMILVKIFPNPSILQLNPILWLESLAISAFGVSWFVKGEAILKDQATG